MPVVSEGEERKSRGQMPCLTTVLIVTLLGLMLLQVVTTRPGEPVLSWRNTYWISEVRVGRVVPGKYFDAYGSYDGDWWRTYTIGSYYCDISHYRRGSFHLEAMRTPPW